MNSIRFVVVPADTNTHVVIDTISNTEFCICQDFDGDIASSLRARYIAATLNQQWQLDRSVLNKAFGEYIG